jgi:hypothetical protein
MGPLCLWGPRATVRRVHALRRHCVNVASIPAALTYDGHTTGGYLWLTFICEYINTENSYEKRLKIPKGQSEAVNRRRTDNTMAKEKISITTVKLLDYKVIIRSTCKSSHPIVHYRNSIFIRTVAADILKTEVHADNVTYDGNTTGGYLWLTFICEYKNTENSNKKGLKIPKG